MKEYLQSDWANLLVDEFSKPYFRQLELFLQDEYEKEIIFPQREDVFNALNDTSFEQTKVVILGQDPYHGPNQAHGYSFSVQPGVPFPPSLKNIFAELQNDLNCPVPNTGSLMKWAKQGVLLLNTVLTVRQGQAHSHKGKGWENFTDKVIELLNKKEQPVVYILWGGAAQKKNEHIDTTKHYIIQSPHPSPLSAYRGFFGSKPFSTTNTILEKHQLKAINWCLC
ncbi:uracil-DNA glycosylase [Bacillus kwashiorkori]|uniref:uracil-DNA glycosylase n=1 Tax=Bacillus kwashiorkori TaxID=1522318 RepID=UPI0007802305|nr:uracil-DNA glycosylase [Bacillus kwashiorkori]